MSEESPTERPADQRVVITGLGPVSSIGTSAQAFRDGLASGSDGSKPIESFDTTGYEHSYACEINDFRPDDHIENLDIESLGRATQFAVAAARLAVRHAGLSDGELGDKDVLISVGTTDGESRDLDQLADVQVRESYEHWQPDVASRISPTRLSTMIAQELELSRAEAATLPTACAAGNYAIGYGYDVVRSGEADIALCGGADALCRKTFTGFYRLGTIAPRRCRPFDVDREGILTGEGAGILVLETLESAQRRGATIYGEVLGYGLNCDAHHPVAPKEDSIAACMDLALHDAQVSPDKVDFISAHGTGTQANDVTEANAIRQIYGEARPPTISVKSMIGHTMGAASALAAIGCALAISEGFIPPTINHGRTDPECDVDCVPNEAVRKDVNVVQNNGLAFGGNNSVVVFGKPEGVGA
ncbi:beta-ketoacyl-[acyl-carrier-protein] synthase family protein [Haloglycomyces albus]|uniref:beta-ketoacyl-[acyl-carrier-protein] synthase family protein n=1 Tax=Haloglycomyces albus TaxID=526067 RepID=UPI00046D2670|nr:beta-ketoacyl-[acyl-carrier-protein] synthase family protein [Haloglycomyces albus]